MFQKIKEFLFGKLPVEQTPSAPVEAVPYKVETPVAAPAASVPPGPAQCGCGRSPTGLCVGLHKLSTDEWASHPDNPSGVGKSADDRVEAAAPVKKAPAPRKPPVAKPAPAKKAPAKKTAAITATPRKSAPRKPAAK
jgi:hypothetical protein